MARMVHASYLQSWNKGSAELLISSSRLATVRSLYQIPYIVLHNVQFILQDGRNHSGEVLEVQLKLCCIMAVSKDCNWNF